MDLYGSPAAAYQKAEHSAQPGASARSPQRGARRAKWPGN